jgi:hypothetical protein
MKKNINKTERIIRGVSGLALTSLAFWGPKNKLFLAGLIPIFTGSTGTCPAYSALDISTRTEDKGFGEGYFHPYKSGEISGIEGYEPVSDSEIAAGHPIVGVV